MNKLLLTFVMMLGITVLSNACEIKMGIAGEKKELYKVGDVVILDVEVTYTHRVCELELSGTKFTYDGMKVLGATEWKEKIPGTYTRQIKVQILEGTKPEATMTLTRICNNDGGSGVLKIKRDK